jgi:GNAT superfamily N-acetyltransferase
MYTRFGEEQIKSGETLEIGVVTAPDVEFGAGVVGLLGHKGADWQFHIEAALGGQTDLLETRFYLGLLAGVPVANVMTVEYNGVGILGHVFTRPEHRRKGICQAVMNRLMDDFRERGGHVLLLGTGYESAAYWIYHSFGFRSLKGGFMRYAAAPDDTFERKWFEADSVQVAPMAWRHWPLIGLLGAKSGGEFLRSAVWRLFDISNLEGPVANTLIAQTQGRGVNGVVLEAARGGVAGCATLHPTGGGINGWPGVWLLDFFTHPNFASHAGDLLDALIWPSGKIIAYVDTCAPDKASLLAGKGFEREGTLRGFLRFDSLVRDVWIYGNAME